MCIYMCIHILIGAPTQQKFIGAPAQTCAIAATMIIAIQICIYMCIYSNMCLYILCLYKYILIGAPTRQKFIMAPTRTCVIAAIVIIAMLICIYMCEHVFQYWGTHTAQIYRGTRTNVCDCSNYDYCSTDMYIYVCVYID